MKKKPPSRSVSGRRQISIQIPGHLHASMKTIRLVRCEMESEDVKLSRIYREAVEQYLKAEPQRQILSGGAESLRNTA